ncbi:MAG TPA: DUF1566 domain-containing protein [Spirochaetota bacterium]|nr:DUF1566 domain-containing protein [Spirochaetota bacterium]
MSFRGTAFITVMAIAITSMLHSQTDGEKLGFVRDIDNKTSEIIVGSSNAADDIKMGDLLYVRIDGKIIKLRATFPMQTVAKCKAEGKNRALWRKIEKGMAVYRYTKGIEDLTPGIDDSNKTYSIGDRGPAGGWIFYDKGYSSDGWRYLEAAPGDLADKMQWYNGSSFVTGATGRNIGDGRANTRMIIEVQGAGGYAAKICSEYRGGGKQDWFLPSKNELNEMIINLQGAGVGGFVIDGYWSSSEYSTEEAWAQHTRGGVFNYHKSNDLRVRPVRAF